MRENITISPANINETTGFSDYKGNTGWLEMNRNNQDGMGRLSSDQVHGRDVIGLWSGSNERVDICKKVADKGLR